MYDVNFCNVAHRWKIVGWFVELKKIEYFMLLNIYVAEFNISLSSLHISTTGCRLVEKNVIYDLILLVDFHYHKI